MVEYIKNSVWVNTLVWVHADTDMLELILKFKENMNDDSNVGFGWNNNLSRKAVSIIIPNFDLKQFTIYSFDEDSLKQTKK